MLSIEQQNNRRNGLGATDCSVLMGLSPYKTPYELWLEKTGRQEETSILSEDRLRLRHAHEETIAREYAFQRNVKLKRVNQTVFHAERPYMLCNLDRVIIGQRKIVECKTSTGFLRAAWGMTGSDEAPLHYILQVQHQLACSGYDEADIAALIDIDDYRIFPTNRDNGIIKKIEEACERFWFDNVLADVAPSATNRNDLKLMFPTNNGDFIEMTDSCESNLILLNSTKERISADEKLKESYEKEIIEFIGAHDGIKQGNEVIATFQANKNGVRSLRIKKRI